MTDLLAIADIGSATNLRAVSLHAVEGISMPFVYTVEVLRDDPITNSNDVLAKPACVTLTTPDGQNRLFHGIVRRLEITSDHSRQGFRYRLELVPKIWFMSQTADCRIFQKKMATDIFTTLFGENGVTQSSVSVSNKPVRDFTVQYNETDLDFFHRLLEEEGYFYYFTHSSSGHTITITDASSSFSAITNSTVGLFTNITDSGVLSDFASTGVTVHGKTTLNDYDPLAPGTAVTGTQPTTLTADGASQRDIFQWPALTTVADTAATRANFRQQASEAQATLCHGAGSHPGFIPGSKFTISGTPHFDGDYAIRSVVHDVRDDLDTSGGSTDSYGNSFTAFPAAVTWRQPLTVPRPVMSGIYAGIVIGDSGDEITTEQYGRVKIRLFWDHVPTATSSDTIWVRVMQPWSGNTWGWQHLPRVGTEVGVAFVDGDPEHPIIVGCLYNASQMPVFPLPDQKNKSGLRTRSTTGGGTSNFSEFSFDDTAGSELVFLHAEKDFKLEVENDQTIHIMHDQNVTIDNARTVEIKQADDKLTIDQGNLTIDVKQGNISTKADQGNISTEASMGNIATKADLGNVTVDATAGAVTITALQSVTLKCGPSTITLSPSGIEMKGLMISAKATVQLDLKGLMANYGADVMANLKGAITMIG